MTGGPAGAGGQSPGAGIGAAGRECRGSAVRFPLAGAFRAASVFTDCFFIIFFGLLFKYEYIFNIYIYS